MKISVLDRDAIGKYIDISGFEKFGNVTVHDRTVAADAVKNIGDADIAVTNKVRLSAEILAAARANIRRRVCRTALFRRSTNLTEKRGA